MGTEYSHQGRKITGRHVIYEAYVGKRKGRSGVRCSKCDGHGRIYVKYECALCHDEDRTNWSNGYGRQISYELCDDCYGRGYQ